MAIGTQGCMGRVYHLESQSGIENSHVNARRMPMTFYDKAGREMLVARIRVIRISAQAARDC
jgi:hypothetical protein